MAAVAPKREGFRARLGFGSKSEPGRRLVKKGVSKEAISGPLEIVPAETQGWQRNKFMAQGGTVARSPSDVSTIPTNHSRSWTNEHPQGRGMNVATAPKKLSKAPPNTSRQPVLDKDTGERKDLTDMLHAFSYSHDTDGSSSPSRTSSFQYDSSRPDGSLFLARLPVDIWTIIANYLSPLDLAHLTMCSKTTYHLLIRTLNRLLLDPSNRTHLEAFLLPMSEHLPNHLFCFPCTKWHLRTHPGLETLKPHSTLNPLFTCPNRTNVLLPPPRLRLTHNRVLPYTFVQLAKRHWSHGPAFGIPASDLARRWSDPTSPWKHESKYHIHTNGHLLLRVQSTAFVSPGMTPAAKRLLLFSRDDDYTPYFSVCAHWRSGILTSIPKCALDHIPVPRTDVIHTHIRTRRAPGPVALCATCRPIRRCPDCPTEYLFEVKLVEDRTVKDVAALERFRLALVVVRWSDLGSGVAPAEGDGEWAAVVGEKEFDGVVKMGGRGVYGVFESAFGEGIPGQRVESCRPVGWREDGVEGWY